jgi:hypothetical protein
VQANGFKRRAAAHVSVVLYSLFQQFTSSLTASRRLVALLDRACVSKADVVIEIVDINLHRKSSIAIFFRRTMISCTCKHLAVIMDARFVTTESSKVGLLRPYVSPTSVEQSAW